MNKNTTIISVLFLLVCLGLWGQYELEPAQFEARFAEKVYQVLMLFVLEGDWTSNLRLPVQLEITRFLAPMVLVAGIILVLTKEAWVKLTNYFVRFRKNHLVIAGLGEKAWQFIHSSRNKYNIVVVEINPENLMIERARSKGISVIVGNILEENMFSRVGLHRAKHLVAYTDNDGVNVEMAVKARNHIKKLFPQHIKHLRIHIHVNDTRISQRLAGYPKFFDDPGSAEVNFFSVYELNARILLSRYPPEYFAQVLGREQVHFALFYFGRLAEHILIEAGRICHFANAGRIRFTIFDEKAEEKERDLRQQYPALDSLVDFSFQQCAINQAGALKSIPEGILNSVTEHVLCLPSDEENFTLALGLRATILSHKNCNAPILVRMQQSSGLAQILESNLGQPEIPDGLYPFGMLDQILHYENILSDRMDTLARAFHEEYLDRYREIDENRSSAVKPWHLLSEPHKKINRMEADHLSIKLRAIRCSMSGEESDTPLFTEDETELLARVEHERWRVNQVFEGWKAGNTRMDRARINPLAVAWEKLPENERRVQRDLIKAMPRHLRDRLNTCIQRNFIIGITGHRLHKLDPHCSELKRRVEKVLADIVAQNPGYKFFIASPLAEGADRMVARLALEKFSMSLIVPLPLPYELYQDDFTSAGSVEEFKELVGKADSYFELPMKFGNLEALSLHQETGDNEARNKQYALAGAWLTENCDELIAIYDSEPESGPGGTGQVVRWRKEGKVDDEYINPARFIMTPKIKAPILITP